MALEYVACDFCGHDNTTLILRAKDTNYHFPGTFDIVQCQRCRLVYLNPRPDEASISSYYPDGMYTCFKTERDPGPLSGSDPIVRLTNPDSNRLLRLCDIGCGVGDFLVSAKRLGWEVNGIEVNEYARHRCTARLGEGVVYPSFDCANFPTDTFDVVTLWHVLEHLPSPRNTLAEIHRQLRPNGLLAIAVPNFASVERLIWQENWIALMAPTHFYHFTTVTLARYLEANGFKVVDIRQEGGANSLSSNILRTLRVSLLDRFAAKHSSISKQTVPSEYGPVITPGYVIDDSTKDRVRQAITSLVEPMAWCLNRVHSGAEIKVYARRI